MTKTNLIKYPASPLRNVQLPSNNLIWQNPYIAAATSDNTRRAYQADIRHFEAWGGLLPASTEIVSAYLQAFAIHLNPNTLSRRLTALKNWHVYQGFSDPTHHPVIQKTIAGIRRTHGRPKERAPALQVSQLLTLVEYLAQENTFRALRDSALLQVGFFGALRRNELIAIEVGHITWQEKGVEILIPVSKTDPTHEGQYCAIPYGHGTLCAVRALNNWLEKSNIKEGAIFRAINRQNALGVSILTPLTVNQIIKRRAAEAGIMDPFRFSSHSLRRGLATNASRTGASLPAIMRQGRWKSVQTVMGYIEEAQRFEENAAASILKNKN